MLDKSRSSAFTLVELAIVIVIIGFIIGGVAAGSALMQQAKLQGVIADFQKIKMGYLNFKGKYNAVPGDFLNAESHFPAGHNGCVSLGSGLSCNGNGNGIIEWNLGESVRAARQLYVSQMLQDFSVSQPNGTSITLSTYQEGLTFPSSKYYQGGYQVNGARLSDLRVHNLDVSPWFGFCTPRRSNAVYAAKSSNGPNIPDSNGGLSFGYLTGREAVNIEQKIDDGWFDSVSGRWRGGNSGNIRTLNGRNFAAGTECVNLISFAPGCPEIAYVLNDFPTCYVGFQLD